MRRRPQFPCFFFFNDTATTEIYTLSLHGRSSDLDHTAVDWINDAAKPLLLALLTRRAADLAVSIAEAVDRKAKALPDEFVVRNAAAGSPVNLLRAQHRREHLDEIDQALRRSP